MTTTIQKQVLIDARTLIADRTRWTMGSLARDVDDCEVGWSDDKAVKWCAIGAIYLAANNLVGDRRLATEIGDEVVKLVRGQWWLPVSIATVNDFRGHVTVLQAFD